MDGPIDRTDQKGPFERKNFGTDVDHNRNRMEMHVDGIRLEERHQNARRMVKSKFEHVDAESRLKDAAEQEGCGWSTKRGLGVFVA